MALRVIQWATGAVGRAAVEGVLLHPELELAGCYVRSAQKHGRDVGEILGLDPLGVRATSDVEEILALHADCVVYAPLVADRAEVEALLRSGKNVVTPVAWIYPNERQRARLDEACAAGGVSLHGTGVNPGGVPDLHPLVFSALTSAVTSVRGEELSDLRTYDSPDVLRDVMAFGATPEVARAGPMLDLLSAGFERSVRMCLDAIGFSPDATVHRSLDLAVATAPIETPMGVLQPGQVAGQRFSWQARVGEQVVVEIAVTWLMGEEHLDPPWTFGAGGERFEVEVRGDPDTLVTIRGWQPPSVEEGLRRNPGVVVTAMHCVNSVPAVCAAPPGVRTYLDLPLVHGRAHPDLA